MREAVTGNHLESEDRGWVPLCGVAATGCVMQERGAGVTQWGLGPSGNTRLCTSRLVPRALRPHTGADWTWETSSPAFMRMSPSF